jgi:hypothetical protein
MHRVDCDTITITYSRRELQDLCDYLEEAPRNGDNALEDRIIDFLEFLEGECGIGVK